MSTSVEQSVIALTDIFEESLDLVIRPEAASHFPRIVELCQAAIRLATAGRPAQRDIDS